MLILCLGSCSNAHATRPRGSGVWEEQAQLLQESRPEGELGTSPSSFLGGFSGAPDKLLPHEPASGSSSRDSRVMLVVQGAPGTHSWPAVAHRGGWYNPCFGHGLCKWTRRGQGGWQGCTAPRLPQGGCPILNRGSSQFLVSSWRILAQLSFALTLLFNLQQINIATIVIKITFEQPREAI